MAAALLWRLSCESRTSFGEPVEPEVLSRRARSGWRSCALPAVALLDDDVVVAPGEDAVRFVALEDPCRHHRVVGRHHQGDVTAAQHAEEGDDRAEVGADAHRDQPASGPEAVGHGVGPSRPARRRTSTARRPSTIAGASPWASSAAANPTRALRRGRRRAARLPVPLRPPVPLPPTGPVPVGRQP